MNVVDANVLLYAVNRDSKHHIAARNWLDAALGGRDTVGLSWVAMLAFLRISTHPTIFPSPLSAEDALEQLADWVAAPGATVLHPLPTHLHLLERLLDDAHSSGNLVNDAHLAALAFEHGAGVVSFDRDLARFAGLPLVTP